MDSNMIMMVSMIAVTFALLAFGIYVYQVSLEEAKRIDGLLYEQLTTNQTVVDSLTCQKLRQLIAVGKMQFALEVTSLPVTEKIYEEKRCESEISK